jgi:hypothetical protein
MLPILAETPDKVPVSSLSEEDSHADGAGPNLDTLVG